MRREEETSGHGREILGQVGRMRPELARVRAELALQTVEASAGDGAVRVVASGVQECRSVTIPSALVAGGSVERVGDPVLLTVNQAIRDSRLLSARCLGPITGTAGPGESIR